MTRLQDVTLTQPIAPVRSQQAFISVQDIQLIIQTVTLMRALVFIVNTLTSA